MNRWVMLKKRKIEVGWINCEKGQLKQVRAKQGGGTRVDLNINCGMNAVLQKEKHFFFPNGISTKGSEGDFKFEVWDYKENQMEDNMTIDSIYKTTCMPRLRFYIATFPKVTSSQQQSPPSTHEMVREDLEQDELLIREKVCNSEHNYALHSFYENEQNVVYLTSTLSDEDDIVTFGPLVGTDYLSDNDDTEPYDFDFMLQQ